MPSMLKNRLTAQEQEELLQLAWLNQREFARLLDVEYHTLIYQLKHGAYKDLYVKIGASRKFSVKKIKKAFGI